MSGSRRNLVSGSFKVFASAIYFAIASYIVLIVVARVTDVATFGRYAVVVSLLTWVEIVTAQPFRAALIKEMVSGTKDGVKRIRVKQYLSIAVATLSVFLLSTSVGVLLGNEEFSTLLRFAAVDIIPYSLFISFEGMLHARNRYGAMLISQATYATGKLVFMAGAALLFGDIKLVLLGMAVASTIAAIISWRLLQRVEIESTSDSRELLGTQPAPGIWLSSAIIAGGGALIEGDIWIVQASRFEETIVGEYSAAKNIARVLNLGVRSVVAPMIPAVAYFGGYRKALRHESEVRTLSCLMLIGITSGGLFLFIFAPEIVALLFGKSFQGAVPYLRALIPAMALVSIAEFGLHVFFQSGRARFAAYSAIAAVTVLFVFGFALAKWVGPLGVVFSLGIAGLLIVCVWLSHSLLWLRHDKRHRDSK